MKRKWDSVKEKLEKSSASFKSVELYGKQLMIVWPDEEAIRIDDPSIEIKVRVKTPFVLSGNEWKKEKTIVDVNGVEIGGNDVVVAAGPCAVESEEQVFEVAKGVKRAGAKFLRGGAYKPRTSPFSFQGLGPKGIEILTKASESTGLPTVTELLDARDLPYFDRVNMIQIGARNSQNFTLLRDVGKYGKPVLLKRGMGNTVDEWLSSADYVLAEGNGSVVLCERGIRTFEHSTRFTIDIGGMIVAKRLSHLPVCADPSHPAGDRELVRSMALASIAAGADMLLIEVHPEPEKALSDSKQQLTISMFEELMNQIRGLSKVIGRRI